MDEEEESVLVLLVQRGYTADVKWVCVGRMFDLNIHIMAMITTLIHVFLFELCGLSC